MSWRPNTLVFWRFETKLESNIGILTVRNESPFVEQRLKNHSFDKHSTEITGKTSDKMQNSGVNIIALETYSAFYLFQFVSFWRRVPSIMYLLLLFASLGTLYEPSRGTQILTIVYNDTIIAKEMFESSFFFISNAVCLQGNRKGDVSSIRLL